MTINVFKGSHALDEVVEGQRRRGHYPCETQGCPATAAPLTR
jgi:hypothetical protein